jgi:cytosine/adenosine deaminase-related metal-dependent hydrolase
MEERLVLENVQILCGEELEVVEGHLVLREGTIERIGEGKSPYRNGRDLKRGLLCPAFTNAHIHLGDSMAQDYGAYRSIEERVGEGGLKFQVLGRKKGEIVPAIRQTLGEMFASGTTTFCDFREGGAEGVRLLRTALDPRLDAVILGRPIGGGGVGEVLDAANGLGISSVADHSEEELRSLRDAAWRAGKLFGIHCGEVTNDLPKALELSPDLLVHLTHAGRGDLKRVLSSRVPVVLCPRANGMLGVGLPPIAELLGEAEVALGTDNVMVNSPSMFREMDFALKLARGTARDPGWDGRRVLAAATFHGRKALGLESNSIEEGKEANFILFRRRSFLYDPVLAVIQRYGPGDIREVVKGKWRVGGS